MMESLPRTVSQLTNVSCMCNAVTSSVIIWWGVLYNDETNEHFCEIKVKTSGKAHIKMLEDVVKPLNDTLFENKDQWSFQQDLAPSMWRKSLRNGLLQMYLLSSNIGTNHPAFRP